MSKFHDIEMNWIGNVPQNWELKKLKYLATIITGNTPPKSNAENYENGIYPWVKPDNMNSDYTISDTKEKLSKEGIKLARIVPEKSALVCAIGTVGKVALNNQPVTTNQQINSIIFNKKSWTSNYGVYAIIAAADEFKKYSNKVVLPILNKTSQENILMPVPSLKEQNLIGNYVAHTLKDIDELIENKEKLIALLEEKRQAVITETVTKGLNPNEKMKDSGVEWIGEIPEHWSMSKVGYLFDIQLGKMLQPTRKLESDTHVPYLKALNVQEDGLTFDSSIRMYATPKDLSTYDIKKGDLLICEGGDIGRSTPVEQEYKDVIFQNSLHRIRSVQNNVRFMHYAMQAIRYSGYINVLVNRLTIAHLTREKLVNIRIAIPKKEEQDSIVNFLDATTGEIMTLISYEREIILKLKEYRQALIYEAVTGKIDVQDMFKKTNQEEVTS